MLISLKDITKCEDYYIDDKDLKIYSFKQDYKNGKLLKPHINKNCYIQYYFRVNGKNKKIYYHHIIVKMFIKSDYDSSKEEIDHKDRNPKNNSIENLCVVSRSDNRRNRSSHKGKIFNYINDIGNSLIINEEAQIYYSLELDKFFMYINQTNKYKELHVCLHYGNPYVYYCYKNKLHNFSVNKFKKSLKQQQ